jgi:hypothetical protein
MCELSLVLHVLDELSYAVVGAPVGQLRQIVHLNTYHEIRVAKSSHNEDFRIFTKIMEPDTDSVT